MRTIHGVNGSVTLPRISHARRGSSSTAAAKSPASANGRVAVQGTCFSFQAPGFFRELAYETFGTADVFIDGHTQDYLIKKL
jgi:hypothetical protein